jgi:hypothetical protein
MSLELLRERADRCAKPRERCQGLQQAFDLLEDHRIATDSTQHLVLDRRSPKFAVGKCGFIGHCFDPPS